MKTPYFVCRHDYMFDRASNFYETRDEAEEYAKIRAYDREVQYIFELVGQVNPPGPEPEVVVH